MYSCDSEVKVAQRHVLCFNKAQEAYALPKETSSGGEKKQQH